MPVNLAKRRGEHFLRQFACFEDIKIDFAKLLRSLNFGCKFYTHCRTKNERKKIRVCRYSLIACRWRNPWVSHCFLKYDIKWLTNQLISRHVHAPNSAHYFVHCTYIMRKISQYLGMGGALFTPCFTQHHLHLPCIKSDNLHTQQIWIWTEQNRRHFH